MGYRWRYQGSTVYCDYEVPCCHICTVCHHFCAQRTEACTLGASAAAAVPTFLSVGET